mmetsp:Transcript_3752/g.13302  ORF Transcript_3752/g.13302 Transcript_3752/m.13302 type:complete len:146 (+) Transcript_3752:50-487(+)
MEALVNKVLDSLDDKFAVVVNGFCEANLAPFMNVSSDEGEHTLAQTDIFDKYKRLFESRVEARLREEGVSSEEFVRALSERASGAGAAALDAGMFVEALAALDDFQTFAAMMKARAFGGAEERDEDDEDEDVTMETGEKAEDTID